MMKWRFFCAALGVFLCTGCMASAQAQAALPRIGFLSQCTGSFDQEPFRRALRELGYIEGNNILILWRRFSQNADQLRPAADELVSSKVNLIVTCATAATRAAFEATKSIPIVFAGIADPVASGVARSLAKPGANATGVSVLTPELYPKRLDLLRQLAPHARRVAFIVNLSSPGSALAVEPLQAAAKAVNIELEIHDTRSAGEVDAALRALSWKSIDGLLSGGDTLLVEQGAKVARAARKARVPAVFPWRQSHAYGALMSYGPNTEQIMRQVAVYVDKILKGAAPADLPIEQVSNMDLIIDLRVAKEMKIEVPQELLYRADEVIR